jgi:hypothetical protein
MRRDSNLVIAIYLRLEQTAVAILERARLSLGLCMHDSLWRLERHRFQNQNQGLSMKCNVTLAFFLQSFFFYCYRDLLAF